MSKAIVRSGIDAFVLAAHPTANYGASTRLRVDSGASESYIFFKSPAPRGSDVTSAILRFRTAVGAAGSVTISARRAASSWKARRINWNNKPGVIGTTASQTIVDPDGSTWWELDVTAQLQTIVNGAPNYGWKITTTSTNLVRLYSLNAAQFKPVLIVQHTDRPDTPTSLSPSGGAVSVSHPVAQFSYSDPGGDDALDAVQVQIDAAADFTTPDFDSGWLDATEPELDLSATAYAGLADGSSTSWRVRVRDDAGGESFWSDVATFSRDTKGTLTITNPAASPNNYVDEFTPPISWTFTGETQEAFRVRIAKASLPHTWIYDSGRITSTSTSHTLPLRQGGRRILHDDADYIVQVLVWDNEDRVRTPGDPAFVAAQRTFTMNYDATVDPVTDFTVTQPGLGPWVQLEWDRGTEPDEWVIIRDGKVIEKEDIAANLHVSGTTYRYVDYTARPMVSHTWKVRAVVTGLTASSAPTASMTPIGKGFWLASDDGSLEVCVGTNDTDDMAYGEDAETLVAIGANSSTRIVAGLRGLEGSVAGILRTREDGRTWDDHKQDLLAMKAQGSQTYRLAFGDENIPVILGDVNVVPHPQMQASLLWLRASFEFWQNGELPFDAEL